MEKIVNHLSLSSKFSKCVPKWQFLLIFLKKVEKDLFLRLQMRAKENINHHQFRVRNKQCLQSGGRLLSSGHENRASPCQRLFRLVNFWAAESLSFWRSNFYTFWEIQKITFVHPVGDGCNQNCKAILSLVSLHFIHLQFFL